MTQTPAKMIHEPNFARSAIAPEISATVMMAKVAWNPAKARPGRSGVMAPSLPMWSRLVSPTRLLSAAKGLPRRCGISGVPNASPYP